MDALFRRSQREIPHLEPEDFVIDDYGGGGQWDSYEDSLDLFMPLDRHRRSYNFSFRSNQQNIQNTYDPVSLRHGRAGRRNLTLSDLNRGVQPGATRTVEPRIPKQLNQRILEVLKKVHQESKKRKEAKERKKKDKDLLSFKENLEKQLSEIELEAKKKKETGGEEEKKDGEEPLPPVPDDTADETSTNPPERMTDEDSENPPIMISNAGNENDGADFQTPDRGAIRREMESFLRSLGDGVEISPIVPPPQDGGGPETVVEVLPPAPPNFESTEQEREGNEEAEGTSNVEEGTTTTTTAENNQEQEQPQEQPEQQEQQPFAPAPQPPSEEGGNQSEESGEATNPSTPEQPQERNEEQQQQQPEETTSEDQQQQPATTTPTVTLNFPIDPSFLVALPPDLRQEIIQQNLPSLIGTRQPNEPAAGGTTISSQFLDAVPGDIQQEIFNLERTLLQSQQQVFNSFQTGPPPTAQQQQQPPAQQQQQQQQPPQQQQQQDQPPETTNQNQEQEQGGEGGNDQEQPAEPQPQQPQQPQQQEQQQQPAEEQPAEEQQQPPAQQQEQEQQQQQPPAQQPQQPQQPPQQQLIADDIPPEVRRAAQQEYDPALFIQSLPPHLRREVLMTAEPDVINRLPPDLASEALRLRTRNGFGRYYEEEGGGGGGGGAFGGVYRRRGGRARGRARGRGRQAGRATKTNEYKEMKNKSGEALLTEMDLVSIMRLLYIHSLFSRDQIHRIFQNVLPVRESRYFLFRLLFGILSHRVEGYEAVNIPEKYHKHLLMEKMYGGSKEIEPEPEEEEEGEEESDDELEELLSQRRKREKMKDEDDDEGKKGTEKKGEEEEEKKKKKKVMRIPNLVRERVMDLMFVLSKESQAFSELFIQEDDVNGIILNPTYVLLRVFHHTSTTEVLRQHLICLVNRIYDVAKLKDEYFDKRLEKMKDDFQNYESLIGSLEKEVELAEKRELKKKEILEKKEKGEEKKEKEKMEDEDEKEDEEKPKKAPEVEKIMVDEKSTEQTPETKEKAKVPPKPTHKKVKKKLKMEDEILNGKSLARATKEKEAVEKQMLKELEKIDLVEQDQKAYKGNLGKLIEDPLIRSIVRVLISRKKQKAVNRKFDKYCISILHTIGEVGGNPKRKIILKELANVVSKESTAMFKNPKLEVEETKWKNLDGEKVYRFQRFLDSYVDLYNRVKGKNDFDAQTIQFLRDDALDNIWKRLTFLLRGVDFTKPSEETSVLTPLIQAFINFHSMFVGSVTGSLPLSPTRMSQRGGSLEPIGSQEDLDEFGMIPHTPTDITIRNVVGGDDESMLLTETPQIPVSSAEKRLEMFFEQHRDAINDLLFTNPQLLLGSAPVSQQRRGYYGGLARQPVQAVPAEGKANAGSFKFLLFTPSFSKYISFENKRIWFREELKKRQRRTFGRTMQIRVRRSHIFPDAFYQISKMRAAELKAKLRVTFEGEPGADAGGLTREFFLLLSRQVINPDYGIFKVMDDKTTYQPNTLSGSIEPTNHLNYLKFAGRVIGMAIYHQQLIDCYFTRSFYKHILGRRIVYSDVESIDPTVHKNLKWAIENDVTGLGFTFSLEENVFDRVKVIELKPDGANIPVTNENKLEYVRLVTDFKMVKGIEQQLKAFLEGLYSVIPKKFISIFSEHELELLMNGCKEFDTEDLKRHTEYHGYNPNSQVIQWFWKWVEGLSRDEKSLFLQFVTGTSKIPLGGFKNLLGNTGVQYFSIHKVHLDEHVAKLPTSHTCFNQLDLPDYKTERSLRDSCYIAIREGSTGFGFI